MQEIMQFAQNHPILSLIWAVLLILVVVTTTNSVFSKIKTISRTELARMINTEAAIVVDTRSREDFRQGHISGAMNVTEADIKKGNLGELAKRKERPIIVVCATGHTAMSSASQLAAAGFDQVTILKEGIAGWRGENLPLVRKK